MRLSVATSLLPLAFTIVGAQPASASDLRMLETTEEETLDGESCLADVIGRWKAANTTNRFFLESFIANNSIADGSGSNAYAVAKDACKDIMVQHDKKAEAHCLAQKEEGIDWSSGKFWDLSIIAYQTGSEGGGFLQADYKLGSILSMWDRPAGFFDISTAEVDTNMCFRDCYTSIGKGCDSIKMAPWWVDGAPQISAQEYCDVKVGPLDVGYWKLSACAAQALAPSMSTFNSTKEEIVAAFEKVVESHKACNAETCKSSDADTESSKDEDEGKSSGCNRGLAFSVILASATIVASFLSR